MGVNRPDWVQWHNLYETPERVVAQRLLIVQRLIRDFLANRAGSCLVTWAHLLSAYHQPFAHRFCSPHSRNLFRYLKRILTGDVLLSQRARGKL